MDLKLMTDTPTAAERSAIDAILGSPDTSWAGGERSESDLRSAVGGRSAAEERHLLLPALHALQDSVGWISRGGLNYACRRLVVPPAEAYAVASFYALLSVEPRAPTVVHVCDDIVCASTGGSDILDEARKLLGPGGADGAVTWEPSACLGLCDRPPGVFVQSVDGRRAVTNATSAVLADVTSGARHESFTGAIGTPRLLRRVGLVDPASLDAYVGSGGFEALRAVLDRGSEWAIDQIEAAGLRGRGGAAFPTAIKWRSVASASSEARYVVCNADESEPGTFKDRVLLEGDPYAIVEGLTIAGVVTGASQGFVYVRGEYPLAEERLRHAIQASRDAGWLGERAPGGERPFDIEIRRGGGAYICGEETALFNSIEGFRGEPRSKPPYPTAAGLFGAPTAINNVETLAAAVAVLTGDAEAASSKLFCLSGSIASPGVYEAALGVTVRELVSAAGGTTDGNDPAAVLVGGAAGRFLSPLQLDMALGSEPPSPSLGSGAVIVFDGDADMQAVVARIAAFFRDESCGQCVPCRVGTVRQVEALDRLFSGGAERELIGEIAAVMRDASICGLGQAASAAVQSAIKIGLIGSAP